MTSHQKLLGVGRGAALKKLIRTDSNFKKQANIFSWEATKDEISFQLMKKLDLLVWGQSKEGLDFIIIIRLKSRWLQISHKDSDLKLARQLYLNADHFLYPLSASGCTICSLSFVTLVSFCHELEDRDHISCMVHHLTSWGCAQGKRSWRCLTVLMRCWVFVIPWILALLTRSRCLIFSMIL